MSESLKTLKITGRGTYRAQLIELGAEPSPGSLRALENGEPVVPVVLHMPLSDARRFGTMMYEWMELKASTASLDRSERKTGP
jgi:hypothetical protein